MKTICNFSTLRLRAAALLFVFCAMLPAGKASAMADRESQCCDCHQQVCEEADASRYVHAPVRSRQCGICHLAPGAASGSQGRAAAENRQGMHWLAGNPAPAARHFFLLPRTLAGNKVLLTAEGPGRKILRTEMQLPPWEEAEELAASAGVPEITALRVVEIKQGVVLSARIAWQTDRVADSAVLYGEKELDRNSGGHQVFGTEHEVLIAGLLPGKTYRFSAVSRDLFGSKAASPVMTFSTRAFFNAPGTEKGKDGEKVRLSAKFFRAPDRLLVRFTANQPVALRLGTYGNPRTEAATGEERPGSPPAGHPPLANPRFLNIEVCYTCHAGTKGVRSHPVDVFPKKGMRIDPGEYKLIEGGRITCMSCHIPHGANNEYRLVRAGKKLLCLGCHANF